MKNLQQKTIEVNKGDYEIFGFKSGYYAIAKKGTYGGKTVWGGDSAWEDCYDIELANDIYNQWDGTLTYCGNDKYSEDETSTRI